MKSCLLYGTVSPILADFRPVTEGDVQHFSKLVLFHGLSIITQEFSAGFLKLLSAHGHPCNPHFCFGKLPITVMVALRGCHTLYLYIFVMEFIMFL